MLEPHETEPLPNKRPLVFGPAVGSAIGARHDFGKQELHYNWSHAFMRYMPNEARREAEEAILKAQAEAARHQTEAYEALTAKGLAERRAAEVDRQCKLDLAAVDDLRIAQAQEFEGRLRALDRTLEVERTKHAEELRLRERQAYDAQEQCKLLMEREQQRCTDVVRCVEARVKEAQALAEQARQRADEGIALARAREEARVKEVREVTEERIRKLESQQAEAVARLRAEIARERAALEERNRMCVKQGQEALEEARRRSETADKTMHIWTSTQEVQMAKKEGDWRDWAATIKREKEDLEKHHKQLLTLEQEEHGRVMSRTLGRVVRSLKFGGEYAKAADEVASRELVSSLSTTYRPTPSPRGGSPELEPRPQVSMLPGLVGEPDQ